MKRAAYKLFCLLGVVLTGFTALGQDISLPVERRMLFNNWTGRSLLNDKRQDYYLPFWTHTGTEPPGRSGDPRKALLFGTNHVYTTITPDGARTNTWRLVGCRAGTSALIASSQSIPPASYDDVIQTNWQANLQNSSSARIETPYYPEGIGTLYFDAINVTAAETNQLTIEIATNMFEYVYLGGGITNIMFEGETAQFSNNWEVLDTLPVNVSDGQPIRYKKTLNYRGAARLRIRRTGPVYSYPGDDDKAFVAVDNICVSYPPSDVVMERPSPVFSPSYPAQKEPLAIKCRVSNLGTNAYERTQYGVTGYNRSLSVHYRWRYLSQQSNAWASLPMVYVPGSGSNGDGEIYQADLPPQPLVGDLEYYFVCDFLGYRYKPVDFTKSSYNFWPDSPESSEMLSPRTLRSGTLTEGGREFYTRLRPYPSPYGAVSVVTGPYYDENPIPMTLISNDVWRGMIPLANGGQTNLQFYFRGDCKYDFDSGSFLTHYWSELSQALICTVPFGGTCVELAARPSKPIRVTALGGGYIQVVFNANTLEYMTSRAEYQNFNLWAAPSDVFTDSNGQVSKQRFPNTFDAWPSNGSSVVQEYFLGWPSVTNEYSVYPYDTFNGWLSGGSAYAVDRLRADNYNTPDLSDPRFRNVAVRLKGGAAGLGLGYIHNLDNNTLPDGIDRVSFKCRLGQEASPYEAVFYKHGFAMQNYMVRASVGADAGMSPQQPSVSVLGYYSDAENFYEYRMTQVPDTADLSRDRRILHELFKWRAGVPYRLKYVTRNENVTILTRTTVELRMFTAGNATTLRCKFGTTEIGELSYTDNVSLGGAALTLGTCGFMSAECRSGFGNVETLATVAGAGGTGAPTPLLASATFATDIANWSFAPAGRWEARDDYAVKGIYTVIPTQKLGVFLQRTEFGTDDPPQAPGTTAWTLFKEVPLTGFGYLSYDAPVYAWRSHFVMLQPIGRTDSQRIDVIVDEINLSGWRGQESSDFSPQDSEGDNRVRSAEWAAAEAWMVSGEEAGLNVGRVPGAFNATQKSPMTSIQLSTRYANTDEGWVTNTTYIYSGWIKLDGAGKTNYFAENFIGSVRLSINGDTVLNSTDPHSPSTNTVVLDSGWYRFELRLGCGSDGLVGPAGGGFIGGLGVAYSRDKAVSWVEIRDSGNGSFLLAEKKTISLDHQRGGREINSMGEEEAWLDQAVRSPLMEHGTGMLEFDYMVHRPPAKLTVQFATAGDDSLWHDIHSIVVSNAMSNYSHALVYLGTNISGYLRVLNERSPGYTNAWVSIDNAVVWDEPDVDDADWRAYNVKVTDADLQRVLLDESKACFLNNNQYADTDPDQTLYSEAYVKTPLLPTGIGSLSFMARMYTSVQSTVFLHVTSHPSGPRAPDSEWHQVASYAITNLLYETYRFQPLDGREYRAAKLVVPTTGGGQRVCVEELAVTEPVLPGFEIVNVRALCAEGGGFSDERFQPLHSDEVGFEAQISNIRLSPQNIRLYVDYYVGTNVWGVENWPAGEVATLQMELIDATNHLYRTDLFNVVAPQEKNQVVQYRVRAKYEDASHTELDAYQSVFTVPPWYYPIDLNQRYAATGGWAAYYIVYDVPVGAVWLNEINAYEVYDGLTAHSGQNKYVEIAVPAEVSLSGWHLDLVPSNDYDPVYTISFLGVLPEQQPVTNGYAFFVVGQDPDAQPDEIRGVVPPLPKLDYGDQNFAYKFPSSKPLGIRLRRPWGMYEHSVVYDRRPEWGGSYSGEDWVDAHSDLGFMYVGTEGQGGSLNVITNSVRYALPLASDWTNQLAWTPGGLNVGQTVEDFNVLAPGVSNVVVVSSLTPMHGVQNGKRITPLAFKLRLDTPTNILYEADDWYRIKSVTVNGVEHLTGGEVETFNLPLLVTAYTNLNIAVTFGLRQDVSGLNLGSDVMSWLLSFGDVPLAPTYYYGRELELYERYWLNANPTTTNYLEGGILKVEREEVTTNYFMTAWLALNGTNVPSLLGDRVYGDAVFKISAKDSLTKPDWTMLAQYKLAPSSFDSNHTTRVFIQNPFLQDELSAANGGQLFFRWVIEYEDPRFSKPALVITNSP
jgi:hypothetical protein